MLRLILNSKLVTVELLTFCLAVTVSQGAIRQALELIEKGAITVDSTGPSPTPSRLVTVESGHRRKQGTV